MKSVNELNISKITNNITRTLDALMSDAVKKINYNKQHYIVNSEHKNKSLIMHSGKLIGIIKTESNKIITCITLFNSMGNLLQSQDCVNKFVGVKLK